MSLWAFILYVLLLSWAGSCLIVGLSFSNLFLTFFYGLVNTSAMPSWCSCHAIVWLVLAGPLLGLLYAFPLLNSSNPTLSLACTHAVLGFLGPFHSFRHPRPVSFPWASPAHSNSSFPWAFANYFGHLGPKLPYPSLLGFMGFSTNPLIT